MLFKVDMMFWQSNWGTYQQSPCNETDMYVIWTVQKVLGFRES